jgi:UDP-N-acetylmuramate--alanine ligase
MSELNQIQNIYFLGIGGIGMSALARYFKAKGNRVAGYDRTPTRLTEQLAGEGIEIHFEDSADLIPPEFRSVNDTMVILTPAIPTDHHELAFFRENQFHILKRSEVLGHITRNYKTIAVAGTHGKTTVSTMIAHIMAQSGTGCNAFLGGISKNFNSNLVLHPHSNWAVTEADEYDRSFLRLFPYFGVVTAMDPDHLDIYNSINFLHEAFNMFIGQIDRKGYLLIKHGLKPDKLKVPSKVYTYSLNDTSDFRADKIHLKNGRYHFDLQCKEFTIQDLSIDHPGLVNVENAVAAASVAALLGIDHQKIRHALGSFSGIQRRFDYQIKTKDIVYIDDYAHHPKEIEATLHSVRELYPDKKITGIFQPHLFSRTRDLAEGFAKSLSLLDRLILLDIYPAREAAIEGVSSELIYRDVDIRDKIMCNKDQLLETLQHLKIEVLVTLGAGDIDKYVIPIKQLLKNKTTP